MAKQQKIEKPRAEWGSDVIVDALKAFEIEYIAINPGATFRGLHDSLVNYGGNHAPEIILCNHEEIAVALAHGYARAKGRPMAAAVHNVVGLQHASMAIYNAWADRLPVIVLGGTGPMDSANRRPWIDWVHTANVQGNLVRDFCKWDDQPASVEAVPDSFIRAYRLATTDPMGPVYICYDGDVQEKQLDGEIAVQHRCRYPAPLPLQAPEEGFAKTIEMILAAKRPVILADWVGRREAGFNALGELAELLGRAGARSVGPFQFSGAASAQSDRPSRQSDSAGRSDLGAGCSRSRRRHGAARAGARQPPGDAAACGRRQGDQRRSRRSAGARLGDRFQQIARSRFDDPGRHFGVPAGAGAALEGGEEARRVERRHRQAARRLGQDLRREEEPRSKKN